MRKRDGHFCQDLHTDPIFSWYLFDATQLVPLNGLIRIATGRDAADAAVCTIFGNPELTRSMVACECTDAEFIPLYYDTLARRNEVIFLP